MSIKMKKVQGKRARAKHQLQHKLSMIAITAVILILGVTLSIASISLKSKNDVYKAQEAELESQIKAEQDRADEIDELEEYVGTDEYVEDVAKEKLGLVYPNEILFEAEP